MDFVPSDRMIEWHASFAPGAPRAAEVSLPPAEVPGEKAEDDKVEAEPGAPPSSGEEHAG